MNHIDILASVILWQTASLAHSPAIEIIEQAYQDSKQPYIIINEDHSVDHHRHVSACLLQLVADNTEIAFFPEGISYGRDTQNIDLLISRTTGYVSSYFYRDIWDVVDNFDINVYAYDPPAKDYLTFEQLIEAGLLRRSYNRRDRVAAENILKAMSDNVISNAYIHVGHAHASERWIVGEHDYGGGWLAAHIQQLTGYNPITVQQLVPEEVEYYQNLNIMNYDLTSCKAPYRFSYLLTLDLGYVGCVVREELLQSHDSDFLILPSTAIDEQNSSFERICSIN